MVATSATCKGKLSTTFAKLAANVYLEIRLGNDIERYSHLPICPIVKEHVAAINTQQTTSKISLPVYWLASFHFGITASKALVIGSFVQAALKSG